MKCGVCETKSFDVRPYLDIHDRSYTDSVSTSSSRATDSSGSTCKRPTTWLQAGRRNRSSGSPRYAEIGSEQHRMTGAVNGAILRPVKDARLEEPCQHRPSSLKTSSRSAT